MPVSIQKPVSKLYTATQGDRFLPTYLQVAGVGMSEAFHENTLLALDRTSRLSERSEFGPEIDEMLTSRGIPLYRKPSLSEEQFNASPHLREGMKYYDSITNDQMEMLAERHDQRELNQFVLANRTTGQIFPLLGGALLGSLPDFVNFIPILGPAVRARFVAKFGKVAGAAATSSLEAGIATAAVQPIVIQQAEAFNEPYTAEMAAQNILAGLAIGGGFGSIAGAVGRAVEARQLVALRKSVEDVIEGRPVDVGPEIGVAADVTELVQAEIRLLSNPDDALAPGLIARAEERLHPVAGLDPSMTPDAVGDTILRALRKPAYMRTIDEKALVERLDVPEVIAKALEEVDKVRTGQALGPLHESIPKALEAEPQSPISHAVAERVEDDIPEVNIDNISDAQRARLDAPDDEALRILDAEMKDHVDNGRIGKAEQEELFALDGEIKKADTTATAFADAAACMAKQLT